MRPFTLLSGTDPGAGGLWVHSSAVSAKQPGLANSCGRPGALQPRPVSCSEEGRPSQQWPGSQRGLGASFVVLTSRTAGLAQDCLGFKDLSYLLFFFFWVIVDVLELFKRGGWNNEHQHPPLGCESLMTAVSSAHCPLLWVAVGKTSDLTPLALSYTLSEHRAALFFLFSTLVWHPELPPPWLLAQPCAPSPQCCCWCILKMQA